MKRGLWITLAALLAFAGIILARLPASWVVPASGRAAIGCTGVDGTLWSGSCSGLFVQRMPVGDLTWELRPLRLLAGRLAAHVTLASPLAHGSADAELGLHEYLLAQNLSAEVPLDPALMPGLPPQLRGQAHLALTRVVLAKGALQELQGRIEVHDLEDRSGRTTRLGSYAVTFAPTAGDPTGVIKDLDGPLSVAGTLRLTRQGGFDVQGTVAPRPDAPAELTDNLRYLGSPDAAGRRQFSLSGTF
ncbi:MAG TPA: type II secretion system protein N [Steroidobacteraceae bacterium]